MILYEPEKKNGLGSMNLSVIMHKNVFKDLLKVEE